VANFVGTMNLLNGRVRGRSGHSLAVELDGVGDVTFALPAEPPLGERVVVSFRPHTLRIEVADAARDARYIWMPGTVEASEFLGEFTRYRIRVGAQNLAVDQPHYAGLTKFAVGAAVMLGLEPTQVRLLAA